MKTRLVFAVAIAIAAGAYAMRVPIDARFILDGERDMRGWTFNSVEAYRPFGDVRAAMLDGMPGVRLTSKGKPTTIYQNVPVAAKAGEVFVVKARVRGTGHGSLGFFAYGTKWSWKGLHGSQFKDVPGMDGSPQLFEMKFIVPDGVVSLRPILSVSAGGDIEFFDVSVEKER